VFNYPPCQDQFRHANPGGPGDNALYQQGQFFRAGLQDVQGKAVPGAGGGGYYRSQGRNQRLVRVMMHITHQLRLIRKAGGGKQGGEQGGVNIPAFKTPQGPGNGGSANPRGGTFVA
jgi:hypothetical protein